MSDLYFNEKKVITLRKIQVTMKTFAPPFFKHFRMSLNRKIYGSDECHDKETKHIQASAADILHIRIENLDSGKCGHCKNESREIDYLCCRDVVQCILLRLISRSAREASRHPAGQLPNY